MEAPGSEEELSDAVRSCARVLPCGAGSKPALRRVQAEDEPYTEVSVRAWSGIEEYEASEFTVTVRAGTPCAELEAVLAAKGQYLPFDPMFSAAGSTVGGAVASGVSGPGSLRYGGIRDFLLGVTWIDGAGRKINAGGKVVKNAAGFDLPRFFAGSLGRFGLMTRLVFKVFPMPRRRLTFRVDFDSVGDAVKSWMEVARGPWEFDALEIGTAPPHWTGRFAGGERAVEARLNRFGRETGLNARERPEDVADAYWAERRSCGWIPPHEGLVRVAVSPGLIEELDAAFELASLRRGYGNGAQVCWVSGEEGVEQVLRDRGLPGLVLRGSGGPWLGAQAGGLATACRLKHALDAEGKFPAWPPPGAPQERGS